MYNTKHNPRKNYITYHRKQRFSIAIGFHNANKTEFMVLEIWSFGFEMFWKSSGNNSKGVCTNPELGTFISATANGS